MAKFDIEKFVSILKKNHKNMKVPSVTYIAQKRNSPFEVLASTLLSLRTKDEVTIVAAQRLFKKARSPKGILKLDEETIKKLIYPVGFYPTKAKRLIEITREIAKTKPEIKKTESEGEG